ncbi:MAG: hypothetical protein ACL7AX_01325 [Candidatus Arsenophonus phytopathogenicus]
MQADFTPGISLQGIVVPKEKLTEAKLAAAIFLQKININELKITEENITATLSQKTDAVAGYLAAAILLIKEITLI